jgi:hypothetical protein
MRTLQHLCALICVLFCLSVSVAHATTAVTPAEAREALIKKATTDQQQDMGFFESIAKHKMAKKAMKFMKKMAPPKIDFKSEPDRWLWFAIAAWVVGFVFYSLWWTGIGFIGLWYIGNLITLVGSLCFLYWLYKKFVENS